MLTYNPDLLVPVGYGTQFKTLAQVAREMGPYYEPEYLRRLLRWLTEKDGAIGPGGTWRSVQPNKEGFAPPGMSFHELQTFADGFKGAMAVDLVHVNPGRVHRAPTVAECPQQGSVESLAWGVHINTSESWHIQAIEIDGFQTWVNRGRKHPVAGYRIPAYIPQFPPQEDDDMQKPLLITDGVSVYVYNGVNTAGVGGPTLLAKGIEYGLFANSDPILIPRDEIDATLRTE